MQIRLPNDLERYVCRKTASGHFNSANDVIAEAVRLLQNYDQLAAASRENLLHELDIGLKAIEDGDVEDWDLNAMKKELRQHVRHVRRKKAT